MLAVYYYFSIFMVTPLYMVYSCSKFICFPSIITFQVCPFLYFFNSCHIPIENFFRSIFSYLVHLLAFLFGFILHAISNSFSFLLLQIFFDSFSLIFSPPSLLVHQILFYMFSYVVSYILIYWLAAGKWRKCAGAGEF